MKKAYTKEDMQPIVDFLISGLDLIPEDTYRENLKKIVDNFKVAFDAAANNDEKLSYLFALYVNNASALASYLFLNNILPEELEKTFRTLPNSKDAEAAIQPYKDMREAKKNEITEMQKAWMDHSRGLEVFKGIAMGDTPEDAKAGVEQYEQQVAQAMQAQR